MVKTESTMMPLGTVAPDFKLKNVLSNKDISLQEAAKSSGLLVMFICNHCPFVKHLAKAIGDFSSEYQDSKIGIVAINSNDIENFPEDSPENMVKFATQNGFKFPYLFDETQEVAKAYGAVCTPDFFLFDGTLKCVYRGQFDSSRPGNEVAITGNDLRAAINAVIAGSSVSPKQLPSVGCNIKWKNGSS